MSLPKSTHKLTVAEYLEIERAAEFRSEFHGGEMFAMAGASLSHNRIAANLLREIGNQLRGKPCEAFALDLRVKVEASGLYTYPDVLVACPPKVETGDVLVNPTVLVEVLSETTEKYDRGEKWQMYQMLPSLREYILVSQHKPHIDQFVRQESGEWLFRAVTGLAASLALPSISVSVPLSEIYARVDFLTQP